MDNHTLLPTSGQVGLPAAISLTGADLPGGGSAVVLSGAENPLQNPLLGTNAKSASTPQKVARSVVLRYALQASARDAVWARWYPTGGPLARLTHCSRTPVAMTVDVLHSVEFRVACYRGLQTCGSAWSCPVCAAKIAIRRRAELQRGAAAHDGRGGRLALVTYTLRHHQGDLLANMVRSMGLARREVKSGRGSVSLAARWGIGGSVRALEVTHGVNGWHPHYHELLFLAGPVDAVQLADDLRVSWGRAVERAGLRDVNDHGVDVTLADMSIADYLTKYGHERTWGLESEVTLGTLKSGRFGGRSPIQLLADYHAGDVESGKLWLEYAEVMKGQRQLAWAPGLRERLGLGVEQTDEQIAATTDGTFAVVLASLTRDQWRVVLANDARAEVLGVAAAGSVADLWQYLGELGVVDLAGADHPVGAPARQD